jgi:ribonuclease HI
MKVRIFTDGACSSNPGPGGWAMVVNSDCSSKSFSGNELNTTNNRMELTAVANALEYIVIYVESYSNYRNTNFEIISDSAYVINSINMKWLEAWYRNGWKTTGGDNIKNVDLWEKVKCNLGFLKIIEFNVSFIKVKGHSGNMFNEMADKLAVEESMKAKAKLQKGN